MVNPFIHRLDGAREWHLFQLISELAEGGITIRSLPEAETDTTTPIGKAFYGIVAVFVQMRIDAVRENTHGPLCGRPLRVSVGSLPS